MGKKLYSTPIIERNIVGQTNKFGYGFNANVCERIDGAGVEDLVAKHGSPLFIYSETSIRKKYRSMYRVFSNRYPKVQFAWSFKTNYLKAICQIFKQEGSIAEVVSEFEYEKARKMGYAGNQIIINGPHKPLEFLKLAVEEGAKIHVDNFDEMKILEQVADETGKIIKVAIRVNMDTGIFPAWTKFGFNYENLEALSAIRRIGINKKLKLVGLHTHIGTFILDPNAYKIALTKLLNLAQVAKDEHGFEMEYIDLGGGFASNNTLHYQYLPSEQVVPSVDQYAEAICDVLNANFPPDENHPTLILESGRILIDEAGYLATTVVAQKTMPDGRRAVVIDAGVNLLYTVTWYKLKTMMTRDIFGQLRDAILYGPLCMNIDILQDYARLPQMNVGDIMVLHPVGAYNIVQSMQFIQYRPRVVMIDEKGEDHIIRERENLDYIEEMERMPDYLVESSEGSSLKEIEE